MWLRTFPATLSNLLPKRGQTKTVYNHSFSERSSSRSKTEKKEDGVNPLLKVALYELEQPAGRAKTKKFLKVLSYGKETSPTAIPSVSVIFRILTSKFHGLPEKSLLRFSWKLVPNVTFREIKSAKPCFSAYLVFQLPLRNCLFCELEISAIQKKGKNYVKSVPSSLLEKPPFSAEKLIIQFFSLVIMVYFAPFLTEVALIFFQQLNIS